MSRPPMARSWRGIVVLAIGMLAAGALALSPALSAQQPLTKKKANKLYVNIGEMASDSDLLDGIDSTGFLGAGATATNSSQLNGMSSDEFQGAYSRTIVVSPGPTEAASGQALLDAIAGISGNSATNTFLVKLEPGIYELGTTPLVTKPFVDIEGSGPLMTVIRSSGSSSTTQGTVMLGTQVELRLLQVRNQGGAPQSRAVYVSGGGGTLSHVEIRATGGTTASVGLTAATTVFLDDAVIRAQAEASGTAIGILVTGSTFLTDSFISASGSGNPDYGVRVEGSGIEIDRSFVAGSTDAVNRTGGVVNIALSRIGGGVVGTATCAGVYDDSYVFSVSTCPA